jgi:putative Holliday junction resolvase
MRGSTLKILAIDHGTVRVGLALSDALGLLARPLETVRSGDAVRRIAEIVRAEGIRTVLLGLPLRIDGSEGRAAERVRAFLSALRPRLPADVDVILRDESLTTIEAERALRDAGKRTKDQRGAIDQAAAAVILQEFLDEKNGPASWLPAEE